MTVDELFVIVRDVAMAHSSGKEFRTCRCGHIQGHHRQAGWGRCKTCDHLTCTGFSGINRTRQRMLERFGLDLLVELGILKEADR